MKEKETNQTVAISCVVPKDVYKIVKKYAIDKNTTVSELIRDLFLKISQNV